MKRTALGLSAALLAAAGLALLMRGSGAPAAQAEHASPELHRFGLDAVTSFDVYRDGARLHLLIAGPAEEGGRSVLRYLASEDGGESWSEPVALGGDQPPPEPVKRGNDVQIAAHGARLVAQWQTSGTGFAGAGPMVTAISEDGGRSWRPGPNPAADESRDGHAFSDLIADADGRFHLVWLDSRGVVTEADGSSRIAAAGAGRQGLMYARSQDGGRSWSGHRRIDHATCECCWNSLRSGSEGRLYVLYRDIDPRDMALATSADGGASWHRESRVGPFDWAFEGCPHVGGGLALAGRDVSERLLATVWTGKPETTGLYAVSAKDGPARWGAPVMLDEAARHSDLAGLPDGSAIAVWDVYARAGQRIEVARYMPEQGAWTTPLQLSPDGQRSSHPRVIAIGETAVVFWTAWSESERLAIARLPATFGRQRANAEIERAADGG